MLENMFLQGSEKEQKEGTHYNITRGRNTRALQLQLRKRKRRLTTKKAMLWRGENNVQELQRECTQEKRRMRTGRKVQLKRNLCKLLSDF